MMELIQYNLSANFLFNFLIYPIAYFLYRFTIVLDIYGSDLDRFIKYGIIGLIPLWVVAGSPKMLYDDFYIDIASSFHRQLGEAYVDARILWIVSSVYIAWWQYSIYISDHRYSTLTGRFEWWRLFWWHPYNQAKDKECPQCKLDVVYKTYIENGSIGDWCPNCNKSLQKMMGEI
jgi:hypothetical protein